MNPPALTRKVIVSNPQGLHARPADMLVRLANRFQADVQVGKADERVDCKSILSVLTLGATQGTELSVTADGVDAEEALQAVTDLIESGFDEADRGDDSPDPVAR